MGYPEWERPRDGLDRQAPKTGRWDDYGVEGFAALPDPGRGRVLDRDDWSTGSRRRSELPQPGRRPQPDDVEDDEDEDEPDQGRVYIGSFISTACWYLVPIAVYAGWSLRLPTDPRPGCTNAFGLPCRAPRAEALGNLSNMVPELAISLAISIVIAMFLGRVTTGWRPFAIGFASAVLGAGVSTVAFTVLKAQI